jgi:membrane protein
LHPGIVRRALANFLANDCMGLAKEIAYSSLLAFFPAIVALVGLLDLLGAYGSLEQFLRPVAPAAVTSLIKTFQRDSRGGGSVVALVLGLGGALWAASGAMGAIVKSVNRTHDCKETRPFWKLKLISIVLVIASAIVVIGTLLLVVVGGTLGDAISRKATLGGSFTWAWNIARWPIAFAAVLLLIALVYYLAPNFEQRHWRWVTPGTAVAGVLWLVLSGLFALYSSLSSSYSKTYGSLAGAIVLLLWLNYTSWAILFGAEVDAEVDRSRSSTT